MVREGELRDRDQAIRHDRAAVANAHFQAEGVASRLEGRQVEIDGSKKRPRLAGTVLRPGDREDGRSSEESDAVQGPPKKWRVKFEGPSEKNDY